jgi:hypothetical protein
MSTTELNTVVGVFDDRTHAENAVADLCARGFTAEQIGFLVRDGDAAVQPPSIERGDRTGQGAAVGAVAGGTLGGLLGAALLMGMIPGVGPVLAGGLLLGALGAAATGAVGGGVVGALVGMEIPEEDAHRYARAFHSGQTLVTVRAGGRAADAVAVLRRHGGHDGSLPSTPLDPATVQETEEQLGEAPHHRPDMGRLDASDRSSPHSGSVFPGES